MSIKEDYIDINVTKRTFNYYKKLGYEVPNINWSVKTGEIIKVKIRDLSIGSSIKVTKVCDDCGIESKKPYSVILRTRKDGDGSDRCKSCAQKKLQQYKKVNLKYEESLEYKCIINNKEYILKQYSKNNKLKANEITCGTKEETLWYCNKCGHEYSMSCSDKYHKEAGCPYCSNHRVMKGYNDIATTNRILADMFANVEDSYKYTENSSLKSDFKCKDCNFIIKNKTISAINRQGLSCPICSDGISYPEKYIANVLRQLDMEFETQKSFKWSNGKRYDFYIEDLELIIESHGRQHYEENCFESLKGKTLEEEITNDLIKRELAINNGINKYIVINCSESKSEYIKNELLNSELTILLDFNKVNWRYCNEISVKSNVKLASEIWNSGIKDTKEIMKTLKVSRNSVVNYLKKARELGWCDYIPHITRTKEYKNSVRK